MWYHSWGQVSREEADLHPLPGNRDLHIAEPGCCPSSGVQLMASSVATTQRLAIPSYCARRRLSALFALLYQSLEVFFVVEIGHADPQV